MITFDNTLLELAVEAREQDPTFKSVKSVDALRCEIAFLAEYYIDSYLPKPFRLLSSWMPEIALEFFNNIKTKIDQAHRMAIGWLIKSVSHQIGLDQKLWASSQTFTSSVSYLKGHC